MSSVLHEMLQTRDWVLADGATGTCLFEMGLPHGEAPEVWNLEHPDRIRDHYRAFLDAGADLVLTNSFGGTANRLKLHGLASAVHEVNARAARLLRETVDRHARPAVCAGSIGPTGELFEPLGPLTRESARAAFREQVEGLKDGGIDVVWIETMSSLDEVEAAIAAAADAGVPACCTLSFDTNGRTMMGVDPGVFAAWLEGQAPRPVAYGGNCGTGAADLLASLVCLRERMQAGDVLIAKANCGIPQYVDGAIRYSGTPELMAGFAVLARDLGVRIIGGCCGTAPAHLAAMRRALEQSPPGPVPCLETIVARVGPLTTAFGGGPPQARTRRSRRAERTGPAGERR